MTKQDDHDTLILLKKKVDNLLGFGKVVVTVCITATLAIVTALWNLGHWLFDHLDRLKAGINAFLSDKGAGL